MLGVCEQEQEQRQPGRPPSPPHPPKKQKKTKKTHTHTLSPRGLPLLLELRQSSGPHVISVKCKQCRAGQECDGGRGGGRGVVLKGPVCVCVCLWAGQWSGPHNTLKVPPSAPLPPQEPAVQMWSCRSRSAGSASFHHPGARRLSARTQARSPGLTFTFTESSSVL